MCRLSNGVANFYIQGIVVGWAPLLPHAVTKRRGSPLLNVVLVHNAYPSNGRCVLLVQLLLQSNSDNGGFSLSSGFLLYLVVGVSSNT